MSEMKIIYQNFKQLYFRKSYSSSFPIRDDNGTRFFECLPYSILNGTNIKSK